MSAQATGCSSSGKSSIQWRFLRALIEKSFYPRLSPVFGSKMALTTRWQWPLGPPRDRQKEETCLNAVIDLFADSVLYTGAKLKALFALAAQTGELELMQIKS